MQRQPELVAQHLFHRRAHKVHNRLRGVDDAVRIRHFHREPLEEALIHRIDERLPLTESDQVVGGAFDGFVEEIELA